MLASEYWRESMSGREKVRASSAKSRTERWESSRDCADTDGRVPRFRSAQFSSDQWSELTQPPRLGFAFKGKWNRRAVCAFCCRTTVCSASDGWISPGRNERIRVSLIEDLCGGRTPLFKLLTQLSLPALPVLRHPFRRLELIVKAILLISAFSFPSLLVSDLCFFFYSVNPAID